LVALLITTTKWATPYFYNVLDDKIFVTVDNVDKKAGIFTKHNWQP